jgi:protein phosphatase
MRRRHRQPGASALLRAAMRSDPGKVRDQNQDACLVVPELGLFAVADGMGGHQAGDVAARLAVEHLPALVQRALARPGRRDAGIALERAVVELSALVNAEAATDPGLAGMGTTLVLVMVMGVTAYVAHVGDSRAHLLRQDRLRRLTEDHCYAAELVRAGVLGPEEASAHPYGHGLTRAIGMPGTARPDVFPLDLADGDRLLLCSDGLTKMVPDTRIGALLAAAADPESACSALVGAANDAGGYDNVSAVVVDVRLPGAVAPGADDEPVADARDGLQQA